MHVKRAQLYEAWIPKRLVDRHRPLKRESRREGERESESESECECE